MLIVETIGKIRRMYHVDGKKIKTISRELNLSKNTVRKVIRSDATKFGLSKHKRKKPVIDDYLEEIKTTLEANRSEPKRRRFTAKKIYEQVKQSGYTGSYESVNLIVRKLRRDSGAVPNQVFIPLKYESGDAFQFDWGEEEICLSGKIIRIKAARIKLCYSRHSLVIAYPNETQEMLLDAHDEAFKFFGGCTRRGIYDNMKTAVTKIKIGKERIYNERFFEMASHFLFEPVACTPGAGWEKGQIEKHVGDSRRNFFTPMLSSDTYVEINTHLRERSIEWSKDRKHPEYTDRTIYEVYEDEKKDLIEYRGKFRSYKLHYTTVSPLSMVSYDGNMYSVECSYVGLSVYVKSYAWEIEVLHEEQVIATHTRSFGKNQKIYNPLHYIPALERKPGALRNGAPFENMMNILPSVFSKIRVKLEIDKKGDKLFVEILLFINKYGIENVAIACEKALSVGSCSPDLIKKYLEPSSSDEKEDKYIQLKNPPDEDCSIYSKLYLTKKEDEE